MNEQNENLTEDEMIIASFNGTSKFLTESTKATSPMVANHRTNILNPTEVLAMFGDTSGAPFNAYLDGITESIGSLMNEQEITDFRQEAITSAEAFFTEATMDQQVAPYAPFQILVLKEIKMRRISDKLITSTTVGSIRTTVSVWKTILEDVEGNEFNINDLTDATDVKRGWIEVEIPVGTAFEALDDANLTNPTDIAVKIENRRLDKDFHIVAANFATPGENVTVSIPYIERGSINQVVKYEDPLIVGSEEDKLYGVVDLDTGKVIINALDGNVDKVTIKYRMSNVYNETNDMNLYLKYEPEYDIIIGDGDTINVGIPMNYLEDTKAFTKVDGMTSAVKRIADAFAVLQDIDTLSDLKGAVTTANTLTWDAALPATGLSVVEHNKSMLFEIAKCIAIADTKTQFKSIYEHNIAMSSLDTVYLNSPVFLENSKPANTSIVGGQYNFATSSLIIANGKLNIFSTKMISKGSTVIVPKASEREERVAMRYNYSTMLSQDKYRNKKAPLIRNIAAKERSRFIIHAPETITSLTITNS